jgi:hypothetical protein
MAAVGAASLVAGLVPGVMLAMAPPAGAATPTGTGISYTLEGCRNNGGVVLPDGNGHFVCADSAYTTGNLGKGWNELDLVPIRFTLAAGNKAPGDFSFALAVDNKNAGHPGYDVLSSDSGGTPVVNESLSSSSCGTLTAGAEQLATPGIGGIDTTLYRILNVTGQAPNSTCVYDAYARLALGSHLFPGSSLHFNLANTDLSTASVGGKEVSIPVKEIAPQELSKDMTASQSQPYVWNVTKSATPAHLSIGNTCDAANAGPASLDVTVTWERIAADRGPATIITHVYATNPASRMVTTQVTDDIYRSANQSGPVINTVTSSQVNIPANEANFLVLTHTFVDNSPGSVYSDLATASYTDKATGIPIPGSVTAKASATTQVGSTTNATATISDTESISGTGLSFSVDSISGASGSFGNYTLTDKTTGPLNWTSDSQSGNGSVTFHKSVYAASGTVEPSGDLSDTATLNGSEEGYKVVSDPLDVGVDVNTLTALTIDKTIPNILQGDESQTFTFHVTNGSNVVVASPSITFAANQTELTTSVGNLAPGNYTVTEDTASGWLPQNPVSVDLSGISTATCGASASFVNEYAPATAHAVKVTDPSGNEGGWVFTLSGPDTPAGGEQATTNASGKAGFTTALQEGSYRIAETAQFGWDQTATSGDCTLTVNYPADFGRTFTCQATNTARGALTIHKAVDWNGVTPDPSQTFQICIKGPSYPNGNETDACKDAGYQGGDLTWTNLLPGGYGVTETDPGTSWTASGSPATVTVNPGDTGLTTAATITNARKLGSLQVTKTVNWNGVSLITTQTFQVCITGPSYPTANCKAVGYQGGPVTWSSLIPGSYTVTETDPGNSWTVQVTGSPATVPVDGGTVAANVANTFQPGYAKVIKTVSGAAPTGTQSYTFQLRENASISQGGTTRETEIANAGNGGVLNFTTKLIPGQHYQMCEANLLPGWNTTLGPNPFVPESLNNPNVDNSTLCVDFVATAGPTPKVFTVNNVPPPGGHGRTIGFWKNWASCKTSGGKQAPVLDQTLAKAEPTGIVISATSGSYPAFGGALLVLHGSTATPNAAPSCAKAVNLLNKQDFNGAKKASDPAFNLAAQLLAAELNYTAGAAKTTAATDAINAAVKLLGKYQFTGTTHTAISTADAATMNSLASILDTYNNS